METDREKELGRQYAAQLAEYKLEVNATNARWKQANDMVKQLLQGRQDIAFNLNQYRIGLNPDNTLYEVQPNDQA